MAGLFYEIDEILNASIMTGVPSIIVEGIDDISIYVDLSERISFDIEVYAVEHIEGFGQGCSDVISAIEELEELPATEHELRAHILGIIDKDVRDFRGEVPSSPAIFILKYYSIESHFISTEVIAETLRLCTKATRKMITDQVCNIMMVEIENKMLDLYYHSLEALRNAIDKDYSAAFAYSYSAGRLKDVNAKKTVESKIPDLEDFAKKLQINRTIETIKSIARGKWLIEVFSDTLACYVNDLRRLCRERRINSCPSCLAKSYDKCLYRMKDGFHANTIKNLTLSQVVGVDFNYIIERISQLRPQS